MQNQWKSLTHSKNFLSILEYNKNVQLIFNKYWIDVTKKLVYPFIKNNKRNFSDNGSTNKDIDHETKVAIVQRDNKIPKTVNQETDDKNVDGKRQVLQSSVVTPDQLLQNTKDQILALPQLLSDFFIKLNPRVKESLPLTTSPKWKTCVKSNITKDSILSRTKHILNSIIIAESNTSQIKRLEDFLAHVEQFPEARYHAIKEGAVKTLLRTRQKSKDEKVHGKANNIFFFTYK